MKLSALLRRLRHSVGRSHRSLRLRDFSHLSARNERLSSAICGALSGKTSHAEVKWIERIEELRNQMSCSQQELEFTDYGAGPGDSQLTEEEMFRGCVIRRTIGEICALMCRSDRDALLLLRLVRELKPRTCVELGTSLGISACYQAAALELNGEGKLVTLEGADSVASVAVQNFTNLGLHNVELVRGRFQDTLSQVLRENPAVDYAFIDGHHGRAATLHYFNAFLPAMAGAAVLVFDDIRWSEGMERAWDEIRRHDRVRVSVDLGSMGLVSTAGAGSPRHFGKLAWQEMAR